MGKEPSTGITFSPVPAKDVVLHPGSGAAHCPSAMCLQRKGTCTECLFVRSPGLCTCVLHLCENETEALSSGQTRLRASLQVWLRLRRGPVSQLFVLRRGGCPGPPSVTTTLRALDWLLSFSAPQCAFLTPQGGLAPLSPTPTFLSLPKLKPHQVRAALSPGPAHRSQWPLGASSEAI